MHYWSWYGGWWGMAVFGLLCLISIAAVFGFTVYAVSRGLRRDDAVAHLRRQLAEGKMDEDEYQRKVTLLRKR